MKIMVWNKISIVTIYFFAISLLACGEDDRVDANTLNQGPIRRSDFSNWLPQWQELEVQVIDAVNAVRASGGDCGSRGVFAPAPPVSAHEQLRTAARWHSEDMALRNFFEHQSPEPDSSLPVQRVVAAGYTWSFVGENIAAGYSDVPSVMDAWLRSDGHCGTMLNSNYVHLGVGVFEDHDDPGDEYGIYWTQVFGAP